MVKLDRLIEKYTKIRDGSTAKANEARKSKLAYKEENPKASEEDALDQECHTAMAHMAKEILKDLYEMKLHGVERGTL